jgi:acetylornithine deacetylase/succinyl-diaminopimelate desuccinylase family protein
LTKMVGKTATELAAAVRVAAAPRREDIVELLRAMIRIRSVNAKLAGDAETAAAGRVAEAECQDLVAQELRSIGMSLDRFEALEGREDIVGTLSGTGGGRSIILNGHVDVVPIGSIADWPRDPWAAAVVDGQVWGRGSCDMKGGIAAALGALWVLADAGIRLAGDVIFESVVDEEAGGPGTKAAIERGYRADAAIVMEPTSSHLVPAQGGLQWVNVIIRGLGGHAGARYRSVHAGGGGTAVNAIDKAVKILTAIQELERQWASVKVHPLMPKGITTINPGVIAGGSGETRNGLPATFTAYANMADYCLIGFDLKYLPDERLDDVKRQFEEYVAAVSATDPWLASHPPTIEWEAHGLSFPPCNTPLEHPLLRAAAAAYQSVLGEPKWAGYEAVTDLGYLADAGIPGVIYGPGSIPRSHSANEYLEIDDLMSSVEILALTIATYVGTP